MSQPYKQTMVCCGAFGAHKNQKRKKKKARVGEHTQTQLPFASAAPPLTPTEQGEGQQWGFAASAPAEHGEGEQENYNEGWPRVPLVLKEYTDIRVIV